MMHVALAVSLFFLFNLSALAQSAHDDSAAVEGTVRNYIESYYKGDARRMEQTLHPHYLKHMIHGEIPVREKTGAQMVSEVGRGPAGIPASRETEEIRVLDVAGRVASAKLITPGWTDYMVLEKVDGAWKILPVVQRIDD
ncbi:MAG TPA: nuclear transport factor 2 family protein [Candidatus Solibacter sp.]|nr:nuclear transport factor 2 family protein [Candidatus Solibacter sp.]